MKSAEERLAWNVAQAPLGLLCSVLDGALNGGRIRLAVVRAERQGMHERALNAAGARVLDACDPQVRRATRARAQDVPVIDAPEIARSSGAQAMETLVAHGHRRSCIQRLAAAAARSLYSGDRAS